MTETYHSMLISPHVQIHLVTEDKHAVLKCKVCEEAETSIELTGNLDDLYDRMVRASRAHQHTGAPEYERALYGENPSTDE